MRSTVKPDGKKWLVVIDGEVMAKEKTQEAAEKKRAALVAAKR